MILLPHRPDDGNGGGRRGFCTGPLRTERTRVGVRDPRFSGLLLGDDDARALEAVRELVVDAVVVEVAEQNEDAGYAAKVLVLVVVAVVLVFIVDAFIVLVVLDIPDVADEGSESCCCSLTLPSLLPPIWSASFTATTLPLKPSSMLSTSNSLSSSVSRDRSHECHRQSRRCCSELLV